MFGDRCRSQRCACSFALRILKVLKASQTYPNLMISLPDTVTASSEVRCEARLFDDHGWSNVAVAKEGKERRPWRAQSAE